MTQTSYKAWDGNLYEWPPPEGWYQAEDGRWWPDGYGPRAEAGESQTETTNSVNETDSKPEVDEPSLDDAAVGPHGQSADVAPSEVDFGPGPSDWSYPDAAAFTTVKKEDSTSIPDHGGSFPPVERPQSGSILGNSLPPSDYNPGEVAPEMAIPLDEPVAGAAEAGVFGSVVPDVAEREVAAADDSFADTGSKQGPASFPPPPVGSARVYNVPAEPDARSPFEMAVDDQAQAESNPLPPPSIGDSLYPPDLATSRLPATPSFDDVETVGGELPLNEIPTGKPPSLANPTFGATPPPPAGGLPNAGSQEPWALSRGGQVASNIQPSSLPSTQDFSAKERVTSSGSGRNKKILLLLAGLLLLAAALYLGSRFLLGDDDEQDSAATVAADSGETATAVDADQPEVDGASGEQTESPAPAAAEGTFANPHRQDFEVDINYATDDGDRSWRIAVQSPVAEADDAGTPSDGNVFAVTNVLVRNQQTGTELPVNTLQFNVATETGDVIRWADAACTSGDPLGVDEVLAEGEEVQGSLCWEVPAESLDSLLLRVETDEVTGQVFIDLN